MKTTVTAIICITLFSGCHSLQEVAATYVDFVPEQLTAATASYDSLPNEAAKVIVVEIREEGTGRVVLGWLDKASSEFRAYRYLGRYQCPQRCAMLVAAFSASTPYYTPVIAKLPTSPRQSKDLLLNPFYQQLITRLRELSVKVVWLQVPESFSWPFSPSEPSGL